MPKSKPKRKATEKMRACICDVCGKVQPMEHYGIPARWIYIEKRDKPPASDLSGNDDEDFPRSEFERICCSWACVVTLARREQDTTE